MNKEELIKFILESNKAGYAKGDIKKWTKENDRSNSISFARGPWRSHDNFFGANLMAEELLYFMKIYHFG